MILCTASFVCDLYFYINHKKNLGNLQSSNKIIITVHFLAVSYHCIANYVVGLGGIAILVLDIS